MSRLAAVMGAVGYVLVLPWSVVGLVAMIAAERRLLRRARRQGNPTALAMSRGYEDPEQDWLDGGEQWDRAMAMQSETRVRRG